MMMVFMLAGALLSGLLGYRLASWGALAGVAGVTLLVVALHSPSIGSLSVVQLLTLCAFFLVPFYAAFASAYWLRLKGKKAQ
jgi:hypothetical protein